MKSVLLPMPSTKEQDSIVQQVGAEYERGYKAVQSKRVLFRERIKLYNNIGDSDRKLYDRTVYQLIDTLTAVAYSNKMTANFAWRQLEDEDVARNVQNAAEFDQEEMEMDTMNYQVQRDRFFYGVGIRMWTGWDNRKKINKFRMADPLTWIPDPDGFMNNRAFHGFELEEDTRYWDKKKGYFNLDEVKRFCNPELDENKRAYISERSIDESKREPESTVTAVYYHYTILDGKKCLACFVANRTVLVKLVQIEPLTDAEKEDVTLIPYPIVLNYWKPYKYDPFGISVPDLALDKQKMKQLFLNLNIHKAKAQAYGDIFLYDKKQVNVKHLRSQRFTGGTKYVPWDSSKSNTPPIQEIRTASIGPDEYQAPQIIQQQVTNDVGLDEQSQGFSGRSNITATQNQRVQKNANLKLALADKINQIGEKFFWKLRYRGYVANFKDTDEKSIRLNNGLGQVTYTLKRKDFVTDNDIDIKIVSQSEKEEMQEREKAAYMGSVSIILQDPSIPEISKKFAIRKLLKLQWIKDEEANYLIPDTFDEMESKSQVELLNRNEDIDFTPEELLNMDHMTRLIVYRKAIPTAARDRAIFKVMQAYVLSGKQKRDQEMAQQQAPQGQWGLQGMANTVINQQMQQGQQQGASSLSDVAANG